MDLLDRGELFVFACAICDEFISQVIKTSLTNAVQDETPWLPITFSKRFHRSIEVAPTVRAPQLSDVRA